jgi:hypothetical protein
VTPTFFFGATVLTGATASNTEGDT